MGASYNFSKKEKDSGRIFGNVVFKPGEINYFETQMLKDIGFGIGIATEDRDLSIAIGDDKNSWVFEPAFKEIWHDGKKSIFTN